MANYGLLASIVTSLFGSVPAVGLLGYLLKRWLEGRSQRELESYKHELSALSELLRFDLQRETLKAQLTMGKMHEVYPRQFQLLKRAEGAVASLGGGFRASFDDYDEGEVAAKLDKLNVTNAVRNEVLQTFRSDREAGIQALNKYVREYDFAKSRQQVQKAINYFALMSLYMSQKVQSEVEGAVKLFRDTRNDFESTYRFKTDAAVRAHKAIDEKFDATMRSVHAAMAAELFPSLATGALAGSPRDKKEEA